MSNTTIELYGRIRDGKLEVNLPDGLPDEDVMVTIGFIAASEIAPSLYGILAHLGPAPSAEDIDEVRREVWANFPRDDIGWDLNADVDRPEDSNVS